MFNDPNEKKIVFAVAPGRHPGVSVVAVGIPIAAWEHLKNGDTQHFDLTSVGIPVQFVLYGAPDHATAMQYINDSMVNVVDARDHDFGIPDKRDV